MILLIKHMFSLVFQVFHGFRQIFRILQHNLWNSDMNNVAGLIDPGWPATEPRAKRWTHPSCDLASDFADSRWKSSFFSTRESSFFSTRCVHFERVEQPQNRAFSTKCVHFERVEWAAESRGSSTLSERTAKSRVFDEKYRVSNGKWTTAHVRALLQNRPSEISDRSNWNRTFAKKVVKTLKMLAPIPPATTDV